MNHQEFYDALKAKADSPTGLLQVLDVLYERADQVCTAMVEDNNVSQPVFVWWCETVRTLRNTRNEIEKSTLRRMQ